MTKKDFMFWRPLVLLFPSYLSYSPMWAIIGATNQFFLVSTFEYEMVIFYVVFIVRKLS
jgi:polyferredoxin